MICSKKDIINILKKLQYYQVSHISNPGEFIVHKKSIEIIRRSFNFPDIKEDKIHAVLFFNETKLEKIKNLKNNHYYSFLRIDPIIITIISNSNNEQRLFSPRSIFPNILINTLIVTEDKNFYYHEGINFYSIIRAFLVNMKAGKIIQGGSTITQQLIKNLFLNSKRSIWRKFKEAYMAVIMEGRYNKEYIMELYLNEVYLGQNGKKQIRGFPLASLYYFGRYIDELNIDQYALLVGMLKGASFYNPWYNTKLALKRKNDVLNFLLKQNIISKEYYNVLIKYQLKIKSKNELIKLQSSFIKMITNELREKNIIKNLSGIKIFTTLDIVSQFSAQKSIEKSIKDLRKKTKINDLESIIVVIDRITGELKAMVDGINTYSSYNRILSSRRSIGSLSKPITYLSALNKPNKYCLNSFLSNQPISIKQKNGTIWKPHNENNQFSKKVNLIDAITYSMNIPTINLGMSLGLKEIIKTWEKLGIKHDKINFMPSILLGSIDLTSIEIAQVFQIIANRGYRSYISNIYAIVSEKGELLYKNVLHSENIISEQATYLILYAMQQVIKKGTGYSLGNKYFNFNLAGKTGTTNNLIDSWFIGIDGKEVTVIWLGRDNHRTTNLYGSSGAMKVYLNYLENKNPTPLVLSIPKKIKLFYFNNKNSIIDNNKFNKNIKILPIWVDNNKFVCNIKK